MSKKINFAAIDIGSNAVRFLIKEIAAGDAEREMTKNVLVRVPLRLGEEAFATGNIGPRKIKQLVRTIKSFKLLMKVFDVHSYRACATSAMRDAENGRAIAQRVEEKTGIHIDIIDGIEEAHIVYESQIGALLDNSRNYIYVDVGGGSTEVNLIVGGELIHSHSYNIGTVRTLNGKVQDSEWEALRTECAELARPYPGIQIIGSGGNINKLYQLGSPESNNTLRVDALTRLYEELKPLSIKERMSRFKLNSDRADVIIPAAEIFLAIAQQTGASDIYVPRIGISDGIIHALYVKYLAENPCYEEHDTHSPSLT